MASGEVAPLSDADMAGSHPVLSDKDFETPATPTASPTPTAAPTPDEPAIFRGPFGGAYKSLAESLPISLPIVAGAVLGPEAAVPVRLGTMAVAGAVGELARQQASKEPVDINAMGRQAAWTVAGEGWGWAAGKGITALTKAGKYAAQAPEVAAKIGRGGTVTPKVLAAGSTELAQDAEAAAHLKNLGVKLGLDEDASRKMVMAYREGKQTRDAYFNSMNLLKQEFSGRYGILDKYGQAATDAQPVADAIVDADKWLSATKQDISPKVRKLLSNLHDEVTRLNVYVDRSGAAGTQLVPMAEARAVPLARLRAIQSNLRDVSDGLDGPDAKVVDILENATHGAIAKGLATAGADAADITALDAVDRDYGIFKSNARTFRTALREKKSLSEVGDAIFDQFHKRPDALRYFLDAADKAGQLDQLQTAFANKVWREAQTAGGPLARAKAVRKYISDFAPGAAGDDIVGRLFPKPIGDTVPRFTKTIADMTEKADKLRDPRWLGYFQRRILFTVALGAGAGLTTGAIRKDPATGLATAFGAMAGLAGLQWAITHPAVTNAWAKWIATNSNSKEFIQRGAELSGAFIGATAAQNQPAPTESSK